MIETDKLLHFFLSFLIASVTQGLAVLLGLGKELWDLAGNGTAELADLAADAAGILLAGWVAS